jgi:acetate kinase
MRVLTIRPGPHVLFCTLFLPDRYEPAWREEDPHIDSTRTVQDVVVARLERARLACLSATPRLAPDAVVVRVPHGGDVLDAPSIATDALIEALGNAAPYAPLHIPAVLNATRACRKIFPGSPILFLPETGFFSDLPVRERIYALDGETRAALGLRKFGFHGLFHDAACASVAAARFRTGRREPARVLSVCLDPQPELAAVRGRRPLMATGGTTPLEGLPGETTSGELDPGIVLALARKASLGPEQIDALLTRESGMRGLAGVPISLGDVLCHPRSDAEVLARDVLEYRIILACGSGAAALGGVDAIAFSGAYATAGRALEHNIHDRLSAALGAESASIDIFYLNDSIDRVMANAATDRLPGLLRAAAAASRAVDPSDACEDRAPAARAAAPGRSQQRCFRCD